jgi:hypothetical protein
MRVAAEAWRERTAAADSLAGGRWIEVLHHAREANRLHRTEAGDDLILMARLLSRENP